MKQPKKKNPKFFTRVIERENDEAKVEEKVTLTPHPMSTDELAENVGYHLDPSIYDSLRVKKVAPTVNETESEIKVEPSEVVEEASETLPQEESNDTSCDPLDYYSQMAEQYSNEEEGSFVNYSEDELNESVDSTLEVKPIIIKEEVKQAEEKKVEPVKPVVSEIVREEPIKKVEPKKVEEPVVVKKKVNKKKYVFPPLELLKKGNKDEGAEVDLAEKQKEIIDNILREYNIKAHVAKYVFGPTVIVYFIEYESLNEDVKSIRKIEDNLSMYLEVKDLRMLTPIPGMRYAGIEVPRPAENRGTVFLGDMLGEKAFKNSKFELPVGVGKTNFGDNIYVDLSSMPHGLVAGTSGSGKSVCLNAFIVSLIYHYGPEDVRLILLDPKKVEFNKYKDIAHLAMPVITDPEYFESTMVWLADEMDRRYEVLDKYGCVKLPELNELLVEKHEEKLPYIVMIMDEFNDWFADASATVGLCMTRLTQKARAAGIHIILATQSPRADVIKGVIKANMSARFAFKVASPTESIVVLSQAGADKLQGQGDMILRCGSINDLRLQGCFISNSEVKNVVEFIRDNNEVDYIITMEELVQSQASRGASNGVADPKTGRNDEIFEEVAHYVVVNQNASVNQLQKIFGTSFNRMDNIFRDLQALGIVSPTQQGTKRKVLVDELELDKILEQVL